MAKNTNPRGSTGAANDGPEEITWEELERTSLWDSVEALLEQANEDEAARLLEIEEAAERTRMQQEELRAEQERRQQARATFLQEKRREAELNSAIERAREEARRLGSTLAREMGPVQRRRLQELAREQALERAGQEGKVMVQKQRLKNLLSVALTALLVGGSLGFVGYQSQKQASFQDLGTLRATAARVEEDAQLKVKSLEAELNHLDHQSSQEEGQLLEALRLARAEAAAAHEQSLEVERKKQAPKKLAATPVLVARSTAQSKGERRSSTTAAPTTAAPTTIAYDFGMSENECDPHDPLCGNL